MKTTRSHTSRAKRISCVTISSVIPSAASPRMTLEHLVDEFRIQRRGDLVAQQRGGLHRQRPGNRHALLLPARELIRVGVELGR